MKNLLSLAALGATLLVASAFTTVHRSAPGGIADSTAVEPADSTVGIISYFCKHDTVVYQVYENQWKITGGDSLLFVDAALRAMIAVTDSTAEGYEMEYRILETQTGEVAEETPAVKAMNVISRLIGEKLQGLSVRFTLNPYGQVTGFLNEAEVKNLALATLDEVKDEILKLPEFQAAKEAGINIDEVLKSMGEEQIVAEYLNEVARFFAYHGAEYYIGEQKWYQNPEPGKLACDNYLNISYDPEDGEYGLKAIVDNYIPAETLVKQGQQLFTTLIGDSIAGVIADEMYNKMQQDMVLSDRQQVNYWSNGWPYELLFQKETRYLDRSKLTQTYIVWERYSFQNY